MNEERKLQYFTNFAPNYARLTGNATQDIFERYLTENWSNLAIDASSVIHDNAAGPGTASQVLVRAAAGNDKMPTIIATDYVPRMIEVLNAIKSDETAQSPAWERVSTQVANSDDLKDIADSTFTHSINNFSIFTITNAVQALSETHRTLKPDGFAVVLTWKRFVPQPYLFAAAQDIIKGEGYAEKHAVPVNGPQYMIRETVPNQLVEAGFDKDKIQTFEMTHLVKEEDQAKWEGMYEFVNASSITLGSMNDWSEEEKQQWPDAARKAMQQEKEKYGGLQFEVWVTVAKK